MFFGCAPGHIDWGGDAPMINNLVLSKCIQDWTSYFPRWDPNITSHGVLQNYKMVPFPWQVNVFAISFLPQIQAHLRVALPFAGFFLIFRMTV